MWKTHSFISFLFFLQVCAVDLTRSISTKSATDKAAAKKLAFSVENILDPTKFCSRKEKYNSRHWPNGFDGDDRLDDDQDESQSGMWYTF